jgi:hypothetical protein
MNLEKRLQSAANELKKSASNSSPPPLRPGERMRPWMAFAAAFAVVLAVFGIPYALTNFGQGSPSDAGPLASADSTTTTECSGSETASTVVSTEGESVPEPAGPDVVATGCVPDQATTTITNGTVTTIPGPTCSAGESGPPTTVANGDPSYDLTEPVKDKLTRIAEAASRCDAAGLAALAATDITTTFGSDGGPEDIASWPADDERFMLITELFNTTHGVTELADGSALYVWPAAFAYDTWEEIPASAMEELLRIYTQEELDQISQLGSYGGWRIGITEAGDWIFFVAGD